VPGGSQTPLALRNHPGPCSSIGGFITSDIPFVGLSRNDDSDEKRWRCSEPSRLTVQRPLGGPLAAQSLRKPRGEIIHLPALPSHPRRAALTTETSQSTALSSDLPPSKSVGAGGWPCGAIQSHVLTRIELVRGRACHEHSDLAGHIGQGSVLFPTKRKQHQPRTMYTPSRKVMWVHQIDGCGNSWPLGGGDLTGTIYLIRD
jgi:hypothetical protein